MNHPFLQSKSEASSKNRISGILKNSFFKQITQNYKRVHESLLTGSENHLKAFNNQYNRYQNPDDAQNNNQIQNNNGNNGKNEESGGKYFHPFKKRVERSVLFLYDFYFSQIIKSQQNERTRDYKNRRETEIIDYRTYNKRK